MDLWLIFITGLTVGGLTCLAVQGGLLASTMAAQHSKNITPVGAFLATKLLAYTLLGALLGAFGGVLSISDNVRIIMQLLAGAYMIAIALNLLNAHPIFRYVIIQPPRFLIKMVRSSTKSQAVFAPAILGLLTIFIPCGTTLAIETLAISTGSPLLGALMMATFTLGTFPLFLGLGFLTSRFGLSKLTGALVLYLGITSFNGGLVLANSPITLQTIREAIPIYIDLSGGEQMGQTFVRIEGGKQVVDLTVFPTGYSPNNFSLQAGVPVQLNLQSSGGLGCTSQFRIPALGISQNIPLNGQAQVEFIPTIKGKLVFTCSMGMYSGIINVI